MTHSEAPLTPPGWLRLVTRHLEVGIPKAHVGAVFRVSRPTVATWVARYLEPGETGSGRLCFHCAQSRTLTPRAAGGSTAAK